jgi:hypothetical protein
MGTYPKVSTWPQKRRSSCASLPPPHAGNGWGSSCGALWPSHNRQDGWPACFCGAALSLGKEVPNDLDVLLVMSTEFAVEAAPTQAQVVFDHVQARLRFQADVFWTKASIDPQVFHLWLDTYQTGKDFTRRGIVEVILT